MLVLAGETSAQMGLWFSAFHECNPPNQSLMYDTQNFVIWLPRVCEILPELSMSFPSDSFLVSWNLPSPLGWISHPGGVNSNGEIGDEYYEVVGRPRSVRSSWTGVGGENHRWLSQGNTALERRVFERFFLAELLWSCRTLWRVWLFLGWGACFFLGLVWISLLPLRFPVDLSIIETQCASPAKGPKCHLSQND